MRGAEVSIGPKGKEPTESVSFRCPKPDNQWLESMVTEMTTKSVVTAWAIQQAREYTQAIKPFDKRIDALSMLSDVPRSRILARILELGLSGYEAESRGTKK